MRLGARIKREIRFLKGLRRTLAGVASIAPNSTNLSCDDFEEAVDRFRERPALTFEGKTVSYGELDVIANRYAHWAKAQNIRRGHVVALVLPNRLEYAAIWIGLSKIGVVTALINNQLAGGALSHCLKLSGATHILADGETLAQVEAVKVDLAHPKIWTLGVAHGEVHDLTRALRSVSTLRPDEDGRGGLVAKDTALFIFTSGTTGLPKAARITHARVQLYMRGFAGSTGSNADDRIYVALPLYHATGGLCALGAGWLNGGHIILKRRFTASHFWKDITDHNCTMFVYIGELCRYLSNLPEQEAERSHKLRRIFGNGLQADIWQVMLDRFRVGDVLEFYGSTEGNVSLFNFDGKVGAIARIPKYLKKKFNVKLVLFDVEAEAPVRGSNGLCIEAPYGEIGECLGHIGQDARSSYTGYADKAASEKKVLHDVFVKGDAWFRTGDLMRRDREEYLYFVDRIGDTFRWKGENVATNEVSAVLANFPGVSEATVYGVHVAGTEGRAGMASLVVDDDFDVKALCEHIDQALPAYARPLFLRLAKSLETTGTFKYRKVDLMEAGFDPALTKCPTYVRLPGKGYAKITKPMLEKLTTGGLKL